MKPMLAATASSTSSIRYPAYATPKLDGVRALISGGRLLSRALKPIPNQYLSTFFGRPELEGLDGELILGSPTAPDVYRATQQAVSRHEGEPDVRFYCFDLCDAPRVPYEARLRRAASQVEAFNAVVPGDTVAMLPSQLMES